VPCCSVSHFISRTAFCGIVRTFPLSFLMKVGPVVPPATYSSQALSCGKQLCIFVSPPQGTNRQPTIRSDFKKRLIHPRRASPHLSAQCSLSTPPPTINMIMICTMLHARTHADFRRVLGRSQRVRKKGQDQQDRSRSNSPLVPFGTGPSDCRLQSLKPY
jgi:hypothetical protein